MVFARHPITSPLAFTISCCAGERGEQVKIVDFGMATEVRSPEKRARYYTPGYSAPEVREQRPIDQRTDLNSLGAL